MGTQGVVHRFSLGITILPFYIRYIREAKAGDSLVYCCDCDLVLFLKSGKWWEWKGISLSQDEHGYWSKP